MVLMCIQSIGYVYVNYRGQFMIDFNKGQKIKLLVDLKGDDVEICKGTEGVIRCPIIIISNDYPCFLVDFPDGFVLRVSSKEMEAISEPVKRAPTPNDSIDPPSTIKKYPKSKFSMYQKVHITNKGYEEWVNRLRKEHEKVLRGMRKDGYKGVSFKYFYLDNKHDVTSPISIANPERVAEIIGMHCTYGLPLTMVSNECYLNQGSCHSGITYSYDILIRKTENGRNICFIATNFSNSDLESDEVL